MTKAGTTWFGTPPSFDFWAPNDTILHLTHKIYIIKGVDIYFLKCLQKHLSPTSTQHSKQTDYNRHTLAFAKFQPKKMTFS